MSEAAEFFKSCNMCKKAIAWNTVYFTCNVSTCTRKRTGLVFCSVSCWDAHVPELRHKESWAVENRAPKNLQDLKDQEAAEEASKEKKRLQAKTEAERAASVPLQAPSKPAVILRRKS